MDAFVKSFATYRTIKRASVVTSALTLDSLDRETSTVTVKGTDIGRSDTGNWLLIDGGIYRIALVKPQKDRTTLTLSSPLDAFSRPLELSQQPAGTTIGAFVANSLQENWISGADPAYAIGYLTVSDLDTNLKTIMGFIQQNAPDARVAFLKQYNPFKNVPGFVDFGEFAGRMLDSINRGVESNALAYGFEVVDTTSVIEADATGLTNIAQNDIHPNEAGHAEIAKLLAEHLGLFGQSEQETAPEQSSAAPETDASTSGEQDTDPPAPGATAPEATEQESEPSDTAPAAPKDHSGCTGSVGLLSLPLALLVGILAKKKLK